MVFVTTDVTQIFYIYIYIHTRLLETMVSFRVKETRVGLKIKISQVTKDFLPLNFGIAVSRS